MEKDKKEHPPFTRCRGSSRAGWLDSETKVTPLERAIKQTKEFTTADDDMLRALVYSYENALKEGKGPQEAIADFWKTVQVAFKEGLLSEEEHEILINANKAGKNAANAFIKPVGIKYIRSVQILVKANPVVLKLPFVRDTLINVLRRQKYTLEGSVALKDIWFDFLHRRPKGKMNHSPEALRRLIEQAKRVGVKPVDAYATIGEAMGVSEDSLKKKTSVKGRRGRPLKKGK
jgi:hypothetical protein